MKKWEDMEKEISFINWLMEKGLTLWEACYVIENALDEGSVSSAVNYLQELRNSGSKESKSEMQ